MKNKSWKIFRTMIHNPIDAGCERRDKQWREYQRKEININKFLLRTIVVILILALLVLVIYLENKLPILTR